MDREKKDELPKMQVGFIDAICLPVYEVCTLKKKITVYLKKKLTVYLVFEMAIQERICRTYTGVPAGNYRSAFYFHRMSQGYILFL